MGNKHEDFEQETNQWVVLGAKPPTAGGNNGQPLAIFVSIFLINIPVTYFEAYFCLNFYQNLFLSPWANYYRACSYPWRRMLVPATAGGGGGILGAPLLGALKYCEFNLQQLYINSIIFFFFFNTTKNIVW